MIVFSNEKPDIGKLSKDRWKIFKIIGEDLVDIKLEEYRKKKYDSDSD